MIGGTDPERGAVVDALGAVASHGGPTGLLTALRHAPVEGWSTLAGRMAATAGLDVRYGAEVRSVRQDGSGAELGLSDGTSCRGTRVVLALPVNALPAIGFEPSLPVATAEALGTNAGRAHKLWLRARGVPSGVLAAGAGEGLDWLYADRTLDDGDVLLLGFGYEHPAFDPAAQADVERALRAFFPDAELVAADRHDWIGDPFSRGTWATATVGCAELLERRALPAVREDRVRDLGRRGRGAGLDRGRAARRRGGRALGGRRPLTAAVALLLTP